MIFVCDILRPDTKTGKPIQLDNFAYFKKLFNDNNIVIDFIDFEPNEVLSCDEWIKAESQNYDNHTIIRKILDIYAGDIVIGFEMPQYLIRQLEFDFIKYINISQYSLRYLSERFCGVYGITTNIAKNFISTHRITEDDKFQSAKNYRNLYYELPEKFNLLIGQVANDKSLIYKGKMLKLSDFEMSIKRFDNLYYKPHPTGLDENTEFIEKLGIPYIDNRYNIYDLLSTSTLDHVVGISSSVLYEAKYFNRKSIFLCEYMNVNEQIPVYENIFIKKIIPELIKHENSRNI